MASYKTNTGRGKFPGLRFFMNELICTNFIGFAEILETYFGIIRV